MSAGLFQESSFSYKLIISWFYGFTEKISRHIFVLENYIYGAEHREISEERGREKTERSNSIDGESSSCCQ